MFLGVIGMMLVGEMKAALLSGGVQRHDVYDCNEWAVHGMTAIKS